MTTRAFTRLAAEKILERAFERTLGNSRIKNPVAAKEKENL